MAPPNFTIGVDAGHIVTLPPPSYEGVENPYQYIGGTHTSISGAMTIDRVAVKRTCSIAWTGLTDAQHAIIKPYIDGTNAGPFLFFDAAAGYTFTGNITDLQRACTDPGVWNISFTVVEV